jgi:hypothetical protein
MPAALMTGAAAGEVKNLSNTLAASGSLPVVTIPAEITVIWVNSGHFQGATVGTFGWDDVRTSALLPPQPRSSPNFSYGLWAS